MRRLDSHALLSALWLFILLNLISRDIHQFVLASHLEMLLTGQYNGIEVTEALLSSAPTDMDDTFHLVIEPAAIVVILWTAWTWPEQERSAPWAGASSS